jgi:hypothetical protein
MNVSLLATTLQLLVERIAEAVSTAWLRVYAAPLVCLQASRARDAWVMVLPMSTGTRLLLSAPKGLRAFALLLPR